jgi:hypothetical protein
MATQLRAVQTYSPTTAEIITGLDELRLALGALLPEAEEIDFSFGNRGLMVEMKTGRREQRDAILLKINNGLVSELRFDKIVEGVETGARRRLTITAEVQ